MDPEALITSSLAQSAWHELSLQPQVFEIVVSTQCSSVVVVVRVYENAWENATRSSLLELSSNVVPVEYEAQEDVLLIWVVWHLEWSVPP